MWGKKNHILAIAVALVALMTIYYASRSEEEKLTSSMQSALEDHEYEEAVQFASRLLELQPGNPAAKKAIRDSAEIFGHLQSARDALADFWTLKDGASVDPENLYEGLKTSREHLAQAKALDKEFETTEEFEELLDDAQAHLIYIFATHVMEIGDGTVESASAEYRKTSDIIDEAASSKYLSKFLQVQSAWATVEEPVESVKHELDARLDKMDEMGSLISDYEGKSAKSLVKALLAYTQSVRETIDTLLIPNGNYNEFSESADRGTEAYHKAQQRLASRLPHGLDTNNYSELLNELSEYDIFENETTLKILSDRQAL